MAENTKGRADTAGAAEGSNRGPLRGIRVLDMSRVLAGPYMTQILGDLGADVLKIERPGSGDDTRRWGPPFIEAAKEDAPGWSAYFLSANRNKRSIAVDISTREGQELIRALARRADIVVENFKTGTLRRYGLDHESLLALNPRLVHCSITGFGQTGPWRERPGYDAMIQALGGIMSITGEADGPPVKVGVAIADVMCGMYGCVAVLAALHHREKTGRGQHIDISLFDTQLSWLVNEGLNYLTTGKAPHRRGTAHPNIVPYQAVPAADGHFMLAVGNDAQFAALCAVLGLEELAQDGRFATNPQRVRNREALMERLTARTRQRPAAQWLAALKQAGVPCGPINTIAEAFDTEQARARGMRLRMEHPKAASGGAEMIASPLRLSETPVSYRHFPPRLGEHTREALMEELGLSEEQIAGLIRAGIIATDED